MISILLVHSEYSSLAPLTVYIKKIFQYSTIFEAYTLEEAGHITKNKSINLIFFDLDAHDEGNVTNFVDRLKQHIITESIPIIFLTEALKDDFYKKVSGLSGYDFIQKPIDKNMFILKLHNYSKVYTNMQINKNVMNDALIYFETNTDGVIIKVSKPLLEISGYTQEELIGNTSKIMRHPNMSKSFYQNIAKDNTSYIVKSTIYPILDINNDIVGYASVEHDITKEMREKQINKKILDTQSSLIIILNHNSLSYINHTFFQEYDFVNLVDFNTKHSSISELFEPFDEKAIMPIMEEELSWTKYIKNHENEKNIVYLRDKFSKLHIYDLQYRGNISTHQEMFVFSDITHLEAL